MHLHMFAIIKLFKFRYYFQNSGIVESGSGDILGQSLSQRQGANKFAVNSGAADLLTQSLDQKQGLPDVNEFSVNPINSGSSDLLGQSLSQNQDNEPDHDISISHIDSQIQALPKPIENAQYSKEVDLSTQNLLHQSQIDTSKLGKHVFTNNGNIYTQTTFSHRTKSQSSLENTQKYHYKVSQTYTVDANGNVVNNIQSANPIGTPINKEYIPPATTPIPAPINNPTPKHIFAYPEVRLKPILIDRRTGFHDHAVLFI